MLRVTLAGLIRIIVVLMLGLLPYAEVMAATTTGNATTGQGYFNDLTNYGCTGCHSAPPGTIYPAVRNAANAGNVVQFMANTNFMGNNNAMTAQQAADIAAYIASVTTGTMTTASTAYNTANAAIKTNITLDNTIYTNVIDTIGTVTAPTKGAVTYSAGTKPYEPVITYTPSSGACGSDSFSYQGSASVAGMGSTSLRTVSITIANPPVPTITSGGTATGTYGVNGTQYTVTASSSQSATLCGATRFSATAVAYGGVYTTTTTGWPAGVNLNTSTGAISGTPTAAGTYYITVYAINPGGASTGKAVTFTVNKANQTIGTISFSPTALNVGTTTTASATATSGLAVTFSSLTTSVCTVSGSTVTGVTAGTCTVAANQSGNSNWNPATQVTQNITVGKGTQTVTFGTAPTVVYGGTGTVTATASSGLAVTYSTVSTGCSVNSTSGLVTGLAAGTNNCTITATQAGDANYLSASSSQTFSIGQASQTIIFGTAPTITVGGTGTVSATSSAGLTPVVFTSLTTGVCTVSGINGSTVTGVAAGTCTIAANQAGNTNYLAAPQVTQNIAVGLNSQTITFGSAPTVVYGGTGTVTATASSGLAVTFGTATPSACSVTAASATTATVSGLAGGMNNCTITADQGGNGTYAAAAQVIQTFSIGQASQTIGTIGFSPTSLAVGATTTASATATSGLAVTFTSLTTSVCTVSGSTVTGVASGTCTIAANQAGNTNYLAAAQVTQNISVGKGSQTIATISFSPTTVVVGGTTTVSATATSGLAVTFTSLTTSVCTVSGSTVTGVNAGTCTIAANQAGDANWNPATQVTQNLSVGQASQTLTFGAVPTVVVGGAGTVSATSSAGLTPVVFTSLTTSVCTVSGTNGSTVTGVKTGTCTIAADQAGNTNYLAAPQVTQNISIGQGSQTIGTISFSPSTLVIGATTAASATATSGLAVTFTSLTTGVCTVSGSTVTGVTTGTCTIAANQAGDANWNPATQVTQNIAVGVAAAPTVAMSASLNTPATIDLSYIAGITGVNIATAPAHGTAVVNGTKITYTPISNYFGTDSFAYVYYAGGGTSSPATVTVSITGRPDPTRDANVSGLINAETGAATRFWQAQMYNFQQRLESRHHAAISGSASAAGLTAKAMVIASEDGNPGSGNAPPGNGQAAGTLQIDDPFRISASAQGANPFSSILASTVVSALTTDSVDLATFFGGNSSAGGDDSGDLEIWGAGNLRFGTKNPQTGATDISFSTDGVSFGMDKRVSNQLMLGMGVGYGHDKSSIGTDGTGSIASGSSVATYFSYQTTPTMFIDGLFGYGKLSMDTTRYVTAFNDYARATRGGTQVFGSLSSGYEYRDDKGLLVSPYLRYDFAVDRLNPTFETGAGLAALYYAGQTTRSRQLSLGLRAESKHQTGFGWATPHARIEYQRHIEGGNQATIGYADQYSTMQYNLTLPTINANSLLIGVGSSFALNNGYNLDFDYQRSHSIANENNQALNFRLSKALNDKEPFPIFLTRSAAAGVTADAGYLFDSNVSRSSDSADIHSDSSLSLNLSKGGNIPLSEFVRLTLSGFAGAEQFHTYTGLGHAFVGMHGELKYRSSGDFGTPTLGIFARAMSDQYQSWLRDGYHYSSGFTLREALTDRINLFGAVARNGRRGRSAVFDTNDDSVRLNLDYALEQNRTFYLTGEYRKGDLVFSGQPSLAVLDIATVFIKDDVFTSPQYYDYRVTGSTTLTTLGYNIPLGPKDSLDFSWRRAQSAPDKSPGFAAPGIRYIDNQILVDYLMAF